MAPVPDHDAALETLKGRLPPALHQRLEEITAADGGMQGYVEEICRRNPKMRELVEARTGTSIGEKKHENIDKVTDSRLQNHADSLVSSMKKDILPMAQKSLDCIPEDEDEGYGPSLQHRYLAAKERAEAEIAAEVQAQKEHLDMLDRLSGERTYSHRNWVAYKVVTEDGEEVMRDLGDVIADHKYNPIVTDSLAARSTFNPIARRRINWKIRGFMLLLCAAVIISSGIYTWRTLFINDSQYTFWASQSNGQGFLKMRESP